jgi:hypothetical protein
LTVAAQEHGLMCGPHRSAKLSHPGILSETRRATLLNRVVRKTRAGRIVSPEALVMRTAHIAEARDSNEIARN